MATTAHDVEHAGGIGAGTAHGHAEHPPTSTGLDHRKLLMWAFLASDCMFFASLIATYVIYRNHSQQLGLGPFPNEVLDIPYTSISAAVLLFSSLTMVLALAAIQRNDVRGLRVWLGATSVLGIIFLGGQYFEFSEFYQVEGLSLRSNMFGASFFTLTGLHGTHVAIGVIWLLSLLFVSLRGGISQKDSLNVEIAGLYWHFVDIVWIVIFTLVYLIPYDEGEVTEGAEEAMVRLWQAVPFV
ncbi:MAG TPA: heme-copper oxidase subunit III [Thermomicrobiales bacterium]|nr:heme-copper oxidase subunit III [Thermomicrobiales bacterium]